MYGLSILFVLAIYICVAFICIFFAKKLKYRILVAILFILIPIWDIIPKRLSFEIKCSNNEIVINSFAENTGLFEKKPYGFTEFRFPSEDNRSEKEKKKSLDRLVRTFLMHPLRGYLLKNGLYLEIQWNYFDQELNKKINKNGRFWITESGNQHCLKNLTAEDLYRVHRRKFPAPTTNKCIAGYPIENIEAKYTLDREVYRNTDWFGIREISTIIYDRETQKELATSSKILLKHNWVYGILDPHGAADSCGFGGSCASKKLAITFFENAKDVKKPFQFTSPEESITCSDRDSLDLFFE